MYMRRIIFTIFTAFICCLSAFSDEFETSYDVATLTFTGINVAHNYKYVAQVKSLEPLEATLSLEALVSNKDAMVTESDLQDPSCWKSVFSTFTFLFLGHALNIEDYVNNINISGVTICQNIFNGYNVVSNITLSYPFTSSVAIPTNAFTNCPNLNSLTINANSLSLNFSLKENSVDSNVEFTVFSRNSKIKDEFQRYKTANKSIYIIDGYTPAYETVADSQEKPHKENINGRIVVVCGSSMYNLIGVEIK